MLFHSLSCLPTDLGVGTNHPLWKSGRLGFANFYCRWDSIRYANTFSLLF